MENKRTVLIVDDDPAALMLLSRYLLTNGVTAITASSGLEAVSILQNDTGNIKMVLLDIAMPGLNGLELCRIIRDDMGLTAMPVIALTARADVDMRVRAEAAGIDRVLAKPYDLDRLRSILGQYLG